MKINSLVLNELVNSVYLGGVIKECLLKIKGGKAIIQSINNSNSLFVSSRGDVPDTPDIEIGIPDLSIFAKLISGVSDKNNDISYSINKDGTKLSLRLKGKGQVKLLLSSPDQVPNVVEDEDAINSLKETCKNKMELTKEICTNFAYFTNLFKCGTVVLEAKGGKITFQNGSGDENEYKIQLGKTKCEDIVVEVEATSLLSVMNFLSFNEEINPILYFGKDVPILIEFKNIVWALSPIAS